MSKITVAITMLLLAATAQAEQFSFSYSKQDFASPEAVAQLHERIEATARAHCNRQYFRDRYLSQVKGCVRDVVEEIVESIGDRRVAQVEETSRPT